MTTELVQTLIGLNNLETNPKYHDANGRAPSTPAPSNSGFNPKYHVPTRRAPPPTALASLRGLLESSGMDQELNQRISAFVTDSLATATGPLAVMEDLRLYENFLALEAIRNQEPESTRTLKNLANGDFVLERNSPWHKSASLLQLLIEYYKTHLFVFFKSVTFSQFVSMLTAEDLMQIWYAPDAGYTQECIRRFVQGVRYLAPEKAAKYNVTIRGGNLYWEKWGSSMPLDTTTQLFFKRKNETPKLEGRDENAIWILSKEDKLYTHPSKVHRFHHSSFASGDIIRCGGDWQVKNGKLIWISAYSGHYMPGLEYLHEAVKVLANKFGISATSYKVKVFSKQTGKPDEVLLPASQLLFDLTSVKSKYAPSPFFQEPVSSAPVIDRVNPAYIKK